MAIIRGYESVSRIAKVAYGQPNMQQCSTYELMWVTGESIRFNSDGLAFGLDSQSRRDQKLLATLADGDIVTINSHGRVTTLYDNACHDATVYLTGKCNSNCRMCPCSDYERRTNDGMSSEWLKTYIEMLPRDVSHVVVTGGEPTLKSKQFLLAMRLLADKFPDTETLLLTNGRSFASCKYLREMLSHCPRLLMAGIPIHGSNATIHDYITQVRKSFVQTCSGIENLLANNVAVELRVVVSKLNARYLTDISKVISSRFPDVIVVNFMGLETMGSCARNFQSVFLDYEQSWQYMKPAIVHLLEKGIDVQIYNYPLCTVDRGFGRYADRALRLAKFGFRRRAVVVW